jgi:type II secretory ATPase GspE/PulE/Tfp pilus assembly ATPase PilB-like protein
LVRKLCAKCKECYTVSDKEVEISHGDIPPGTTLFRGKGCPECDGAGFRGRVGIYELLLMNQPLRDLLIKGAGSDALRRAARERGMRTLRQDAIDKAVQGITSLSEVLSSTRADE